MADSELTLDGWFTWMIRDPGPLSKTNPGINGLKMVVPHSAEGYWPHLQELLHAEGRRASWFCSNLKDGRCYQHYPIFTKTWTSGSAYPNENGLAWENEGVKGEPLTDKQVDNCVRIIRAVSTLKGWEPRRPADTLDKTATCYEHNECVRFGSSFTECPSGRIPWDRIMEELMGPTKEEFQALFRLVLEIRQTLGAAVFDLAKQVYGDGDPRTDDLKSRVDALEAADK